MMGRFRNLLMRLVRSARGAAQSVPNESTRADAAAAGQTSEAFATTLAERDGYRSAYLAVSQERDEVLASAQKAIAERDGYLAAFNAVQSELHAVRTQALQVGIIPNAGQAAGDIHILIMTMPKSGTVFMQTKLSQGLGLAVGRVCSGAFPRDLINFHLLQAFKQANSIAMSHADASSENLGFLSSGNTRFVCHVRDPRAATFSMLHHLTRYHADPELRKYLEIVHNRPPEEFYDRDLSGQIDWMVDNYLPSVVVWLQTWLDAFETNEFVRQNGIITTYDELLQDEDGILKRILHHFRVEPDRLKPVEVRKDMSSHFRSGNDVEWRETFSPAQRERAAAAVPAAMKARFNWV